MVDGLPVGMMLVAKDFDEETIYRAAAAFERGVDWKSLTAS
jgi:amidase